MIRNLLELVLVGAVLTGLVLSHTVPAVAEETARTCEASTTMPVTTKSEEARAAYLEGRRYLDHFRIDAARPHFERALELDPDFPLARLGRAFSQPRFKEMFEIVDALADRLEEADLSEGERLYLESVVAGFNNDSDTQEAKLRALVRCHPRDPRTHYRLGNYLFFGKNELVTAREEYLRAVEVEPDFALAHNRLGMLAWRQDRFEEAESHYREALELDPDNPATHDNYGALLLKQGRYGKAVDRFQKALEIEPMYESAHRGIATAWMHQGRHGKARRHLRRLYDKAPNDGVRSGIHFALAVTYADQGRLDEAIRELESNYELSELIEDTIAMAMDLSNLAWVLLEAGEVDAAEERFEQALEVVLASDHAEARKESWKLAHVGREGWIALARGDLATARAQAEKLRRAVEGREDLWFFTEGAHELAGAADLAEQNWDRALEELRQADTGDAYNMYRRALAWRGKGDEDQYRKMLRYVTEYRGVLNLRYAFVRRKAQRQLETATEPASADRTAATGSESLRVETDGLRREPLE